MDIDHIKSLVELMAENDLSRIEIREGDTHILLRRGQPVLAGGMGVAPASHVLAAAQLATAGPASPTPSAAAPAAGGNGTAASATENEALIRSPMVGTFYSSPEPDAPAFVTVGGMVGPESVVCLIEAMKVFNEIKAEVSGRITRVLVKNAQAVEFDQPLFAVAPA
jgi:acetyl-CoA carboxylase biotin carboxyl carrier protein